MSEHELPIGAPIWIDLLTSDTAGATSFYEQVLGWEAQPAVEEFGGYITFLFQGHPVAGCMEREPQNPTPDAWTTYLRSSDARATVALAEENKGQVLVPVQDVGDMGSMAIVMDPGGAIVGIWEPKSHGGFIQFPAIGTPGWFDMQTRDYSQTLEFYREVFGWTTNVLSDTPEFKYTTLKVGEAEYAGIMDGSTFLPEGVPAHWTVVFGVADTDASVAQVESLGGSVVRPAADSPWGRLATVADPTGATFALISPL